MSDTPIYDNVVKPTPTFDSIMAKAAEEADARKEMQNQIIAQHAEGQTANWASFAKAIVAGVIGFAGAFLSALLPFVVEGHSINAAGWVTAAIAGITFLAGSFGIVYATPNTVKR